MCLSKPEDAKPDCKVAVGSDVRKCIQCGGPMSFAFGQYFCRNCKETGNFFNDEYNPLAVAAEMEERGR